MSQNLILYPMALVVFYPWVFACCMFFVRSRATKTKQISIKYFLTYSPKYEVPEFLQRASNHFNNQFQVPTIFLITCVVVMHLSMVHMVTLTLAWLFVGLRAIHAYIHMGSNRLMKRASAYALSWVCMLLMWVYILVGVSF